MVRFAEEEKKIMQRIKYKINSNSKKKLIQTILCEHFGIFSLESSKNSGL